MREVKSANGHKSKAERDLGVLIYDKEDPFSVYNLVSPEFQTAMDNMPEYLKEYGEGGLDNTKALNVKDYQLRISFWREYNYAIQVKKKISLAQVYRGICSKEYFFRKVLTNKKKLAWIIYPPSDYQASIEEMLDLAMREMRDILTLPHKRTTGSKKSGVKVVEVDHKLINQKIKIWGQVEARVKGLPVKKFQVDQRNLNLNYTKEEREVPIKGRDQMRSMQEIDAEIARLEAEVENPSPMLLDKSREGDFIDAFAEDVTDEEMEFIPEDAD